MHDHDPLCGYGYGRAVDCVDCDLIARVRADEQRQAQQRVKAVMFRWPTAVAIEVRRRCAAAAGGDA